ncbi:MAG TPA: hypothetical protein VGR02_17420 [Thermoanaerobaculia bacterium]|nr:hypothetical protein [Thermoanaerobaculia bacterium]
MSLPVASSLAAAAALFAVAPQATPIDRALPLVGLLLALLALLAERWWAAVVMALPLLALAAISFSDDYSRLLAYGVITAIAFAAALYVAPLDRWRASAFVIAGVLLLRWIPPRHVVRELVVMAGALAILHAFRRPSAFAVALALLIALFTPGVPMRTAVLPFLVAAIVFVVRPRVPAIVGALLAALLLLFFPWSGVLARATPLLRLLPRPEARRHGVNIALAPGESTTLEVPWNMRWLIVSASNASRMKRGELLGRIDDQPIRIGDVADWGARRREHSYQSRNPLPRDPAGKLRAYGYDAWIDGAGRIALPAGAQHITVTADGALDKEVRLQIEAFQ